MKILCVEDGSVDIVALERDGLKDGQLLVYRSGAKPPFVLDVPDNHIGMYQKFNYIWEQLKNFVKENENWSTMAKETLNKMNELEETWKVN